MISKSAISSCFKGVAAKNFNTILDKKAINLSESDYFLLYDFVNFFALKRKYAQYFYHQIAIMDKIGEVHKTCPQIKIQPTFPEGCDFFFPFPACEDPQEVQFVLFLNFITTIHSLDFIYQDSEFIKKVINKMVESNNADFQNYLKGQLVIYYHLFINRRLVAN